jgi:hypothetical protein
MTNWPVRQVIALVLAVFVTLGLSLSVVQANDMAVKMAMTSDMGVSGHGECHGCDAGMTKSMVCAVACPVSAAVPHVGPVAEISTPTKLALPRMALLLGSASPLDPYPPRSIDIV